VNAGLIVLAVIAILVVFVLFRAVRIVPQARAGLVERLGRYHRTLDAGLALIIPFVDRLRPLVDLREQVVSFPPQPVITEDNLVVSIDTVVYYQVTEAKAATYEIANFITGIEQLTVTTLRNVIGGMSLEDTLTSRDQINAQLRVVLDEATGKWGIRVNRVELKAIDPPGTIQEAMEKQMRAERDRRAAILTAEGVKQSQILTAEGEKQGAILRGGREAIADPPRRGPVAGYRHGLQSDPRRRRRSQAARVSVSAGAATDRPGGRQQGLDHSERVRAGPRAARLRHRGW
jgi:regulator of protease activity HflC (stomatin/prohibitin superfamily)